MAKVGVGMHEAWGEALSYRRALTRFLPFQCQTSEPADLLADTDSG